MNYEWLSIAMRLIVPYAKIHGRSHASRERKRSYDRRHSFSRRSRVASRILADHLSATPRVSPRRYSAAPSRARPAERL